MDSESVDDSFDDSTSPKQEKGEVANEKESQSRNRRRSATPLLGLGLKGGSEDLDPDALRRAWQQDIVNRANRLFVRLNITASPIRTFDELQRSASSMFVGIFETMFNLRLKNVVRTPTVVADYVGGFIVSLPCMQMYYPNYMVLYEANAQLVMTALSESLPIDLSHISGEDIYNGNPEYINQLLSIFENIWSQLFDSQPARNNVTMDSEDLSQYEIDQGNLKHMINNSKNSPSDNQRNVRTDSELELEASLLSPTLADSSVLLSPSLRPESSRTDESKSTPRTRAKSSKSKGSKKKPKSKKVYKKSRNSKSSTNRKINMNQENEKSARRPLKSYSPTNTMTKSRKPFKTRSSEINRKPKSNSKRILKKDSENSFIMRKKTEQVGIGTLSRRYPVVYQHVLKKRGVLKSTLKRSRQKGPGAASSELENRMKIDTHRHKKVYDILLKQHESEARRKLMMDRTRARLAIQNMKHEKKVEKTKTKRLQSDLDGQQLSRAMRRATHEENLVRKMFDDSLKLEHEMLLEQKRAKEEAQKKVDEEQLNRYESMEKFILDHEQMVKESIEAQKQADRLSQYEQRVAFRQLEAEMKQNFKAKLDSMNAYCEQQNKIHILKNKITIEKSFSGMNDYVGDVAAERIRETLTST